MDQATARRLLGVGIDATPADVLAAYGRAARRLKRRLVEASTVEGRDRSRRALKNLMVMRDLALGQHHAEELGARRATERPVLVDDWWQPEEGVPPGLRDRADALRWLGLAAHAAPPTIRRVLDARGRLIKLRIARAETEYDLHLWQRTLADFRRVSALALAAGQPGTDEPPEIEDTVTETPPAP